jgi:hypothetical protein
MERRDPNHRAHDETRLSSISETGGIPPCSSQCCANKIPKISQIESDLVRLQAHENSEIQKVHQMIFPTAELYLIFSCIKSWRKKNQPSNSRWKRHASNVTSSNGTIPI